MSHDHEEGTWIPQDSPDDSALAILRIVNEEGTRLGAAIQLEENEEGEISNRACVSLRTKEKVFRIRLSWVRNNSLERASGLGNGYIETDWKLKLHSPIVAHPPKPPFQWQMERILSAEEIAAGPPFPAKVRLDELRLRQIIHEKLGFPLKP